MACGPSAAERNRAPGRFGGRARWAADGRRRSRRRPGRVVLLPGSLRAVRARCKRGVDRPADGSGPLPTDRGRGHARPARGRLLPGSPPAGGRLWGAVEPGLQSQPMCPPAELALPKRTPGMQCEAPGQRIICNLPQTLRLRNSTQIGHKLCSAADESVVSIKGIVWISGRAVCGTLSPRELAVPRASHGAR
jgi:hypothetical protein